jgi:hypothetical protein
LGEGPVEEACAGKPQAGFCEGEAYNGAWWNIVTLPIPKGGSNGEYKAHLHTEEDLSTRLEKPQCGEIGECQARHTLSSDGFGERSTAMRGYRRDASLGIGNMSASMRDAGSGLVAPLCPAWRRHVFVHRQLLPGFENAKDEEDRGAAHAQGWSDNMDEFVE